MATLTGITAKRAQEIWDSSVVSGSINQGTGRLELMTRGGTVLDGGSIINPSLTKAYPVGSIYMNVTSTNPAALIGFGTWERWAVGRMPIGIDTSNPRYSSSESFGGAERVTLTSEESGLRDHAHGINLNTDTRSITAMFRVNDSSGPPSGGGEIDSANGGPANTAVIDYSGHFHNVSGGTAGVGNYNANQSHENMPPFLACYIWKRTA